MCGFFQSRRATFPLITISLDASNAAWLWWAEAGEAERRVAASAALTAGRHLMTELRVITRGNDIAAPVATVRMICQFGDVTGTSEPAATPWRYLVSRT